MLGGGDLAGIFSQDNQSAQTLVEFLASKDYGTTGTRRPDLDLPADRLRHEPVPHEVLASIAKFAYESTEFVFDGSDQMPGEVGSGSFWRR